PCSAGTVMWAGTVITGGCVSITVMKRSPMMCFLPHLWQYSSRPSSPIGIHFRMHETYPRRRSGRTVFYAMKFDSHKPIVFALSAAIPDRYRQAMRDGVLYWNKALGRPLLQVIDAPDDVTAPSPRYNVIQWVGDGRFGSTS